MSRTIRFHLDDNCPKAIADGLRRRGIDVTTTHQVGLSGAADEEQAAFALAEGRVIFTQDEDFLRIHSSHVPHAAIAYCRQGRRSIGQIIAGLVLIWEVMEPGEMQQWLERL